MTKKKRKLVAKAGKKNIFLGADGRLSIGRGGPGIDTYYNSDSMAITRANGKEFGQASHIASIIGFSLRIYKRIFYRWMHPGFQSTVRDVARADKDHLTGQRDFNFPLHGKVLEGFQFCGVDYDRTATFPIELSISEDRKQIEYKTLSIQPERDLNFPNKTDFFRLFFTATFISFYEYDEEKEVYIPPENREYVFTQTQESSMYEKVSATGDITMNIDFDIDPDPKYGLIICVGIEFFDVTGLVANGKREWGAMKVLKVV